MSDLISRSELIKLFKEHMRTARDFREIIINIIPTIKNQPTAYDIDKVVEEFERKMKEVRNTEYSTDTFVNESIRTIVINTIYDLEEIVKQGGVSDDVCEWKDKELYGYYTSCTDFRSCIACKDTYWKYCPYCGKKIKIVGD